MRKFVFIALLGVITILYPGCTKEVISLNETFPALEPSSADSASLGWSPVLLSTPDEFPLEAPEPVNSPGYSAEIYEIIGWQKSLSRDQVDQIDYWKAGGVLRWNEILRELVAKYNIPPYQDPDGRYPAPSPANPFAYPYFPFSNPPYAARAYAYVTAAQYDALIAASYYRNLYKRQSPAKFNDKIRLLVPEAQAGRYSYPSDDAVIAGVTVEIMKLLFPGEIAYVQQRSQEHKLSKLMAGACTRSDLEAGDKLGRLVALKFIARARADGAGQAAGNPALWGNLEQQCIARGEIPWLSQEIPLRPPMLPGFGVVKGFLLDSIDVINGRPAGPPSTNSEQFRKEMEEVLWYSEHSTPERYRLVNFWADGAGTSTPPGHWNAIACEAFVNQNYSEVRWARNLALLNMAMLDAAICCWDVKFLHFNPRPSQVDPRIKTLTGLPNFPSFPSGHSTFSGAAAVILSYFIPSMAETFNLYAEEAAISRLYGGIHYRSDCEVGLVMGRAIGEKAVARAQEDGAGR